MIGYVISIIIISIFVSIVTEQMLIRRMQLGEGVVVTKGKCVLKNGYGLLSTSAPTTSTPTTSAPTTSTPTTSAQQNMHDIGEYNSELSSFYKPLLK